MPKATYMYWQKRFDRENPNKELEDKILEIHNENKDFGYRRMHGMLRKLGYVVNKKRVQRIMQKLGLQVTSFTRKSRKYSSYKGKIGKVAPNRIHRRFHTHIPHQKIATDTTEFKYYDYISPAHFVNDKWCSTFICWADDDIVCQNQGEPMAEKLEKSVPYFDSYHVKGIQNNHCFHLNFGTKNKPAVECMNKSVEFLEKITQKETVTA